MRRRPDPLLANVEGYFEGYLRQTRGASPHTIRAYRDGLRLFFTFLARRTKKAIVELALEHIRADHVLAFLDHVETARSNQPTTRNCRLAAIRGLAEYLLRHDFTHVEQYRQIIAIPAKRSLRRPASYLEPEDVREIIHRIDKDDHQALRDKALILFLYNTGARISEALAVNPRAVDLARPPQVRIVGKGGKERVCPLWKETATLLRRLMENGDSAVDRPLFQNQRGERLTRDGAAYILSKHVSRAAKDVQGLRRVKVTPHILRHSCAVALLQSGVDLVVIRDYLGHASVSSTNHYLSSNLDSKKKVLRAFWKKAGLKRNKDSKWKPSAGVLGLLESL